MESFRWLTKIITKFAFRWSFLLQEGSNNRGRNDSGLDWKMACRKIKALFQKYWRRQWHPTPVLLPGQSHGWRSLVGYSPRGHKESDTTKRLHFVQSLSHVWLFETPWTAAHQASLSITNSQSLLKLMWIESVMPSMWLQMALSHSFTWLSHPIYIGTTSSLSIYLLNI